MDITVVGAGHVGLVSAACLSAVGHRVRVQDIDADRIERLTAGETPFLEPDLPEVLCLGRQAGRLSFHTDPVDALPGAALVFVCVNTSAGPDGGVDLTGVISATRAAARHASDGAVLVNRSTSPVGTAHYILSILEECRGRAIGVAVNPEFLAEGPAVHDFLVPDRVVFGAWEEESLARLRLAYEPILERRLPVEVPSTIRTAAGQTAGRVPLVVTRPPTAELTKYAANAFLAVRISFVNEIAGIAEEVGADVSEVARAIGLDHRIGPHFLQAGIGWGGSCFPKDILALQGMAETHGLAARMLRAANTVNAEQHRWVVRKLQRYLKTLFGRRVALLGLSFKPKTDDLRSAPALEIGSQLARLGALVRAFDPVVKSLPPDLGGLIELADDPLSAARGADALVLVTEWSEFAELDLDEIRSVMKTPLLLDGRNLFDPDAARAAGFTYVGVGREPSAVELIGERAEGKGFAAETWDQDALVGVVQIAAAGR